MNSQKKIRDNPLFLLLAVTVQKVCTQTSCSGNQPLVMSQKALKVKPSIFAGHCSLEIYRVLEDNSSYEVALLESKLKNTDMKMGQYGTFNFFL